MATSQRMAPATQPVPVDYAPVQYAGGGDEPDLEERELVERARTDQAAFAEEYRHMSVDRPLLVVAGEDGLASRTWTPRASVVGREATAARPAPVIAV